MTRLGSVDGGRKKARYLAAAALVVSAAMGAGFPGAAHAQQGRAQAAYDFDLPAQPLARSVSEVASRAGLQVLFDGTDETEVRVGALKGRMTAEQALARILAGTGFTYQYVRPGVITLKRVTAEALDGERVTSAVKVEGLQGSPYFGGAGVAAGVNGVNGSRDITATEGTGSFTSGALTIGSKVPQAMKDVPQSISVLTSERMQQQNVTDLNSAMRQLPGVTVVQGEANHQNTFHSRGFEVTSIQIDGGAPLSTRFQFEPQIDMSIYDHVELLRGAAGQFGSYGDPSGTVNLVRKKPLDHAQVGIEAQAGSWSNYRIVVDATSPLAFDGKLRGRIVMTYQDNRHFYDVAKDNKTLVYGIAELDVTPTTLVTAGVSHSRQDSVPWSTGMPRYQTGGDLGLPRSTSFAFPWNRWSLDTTEIFGRVEQKIGGDWTFNLNLTHNRQRKVEKIGASLFAVNPTNGAGPGLFGYRDDTHTKQLSTEATLSGAFMLLGQRQEVTVGVNRSHFGGSGVRYDSLVQNYLQPYQPYPGGPVYCVDYGANVCPIGSIPGRPPINVFDFDPLDPLYTEPRNSLPVNRTREYGQTQMSAYINLRITPLERLHLTTGMRWSYYKSDNVRDRICASIPISDPGYSPNCFGREVGDAFATDTFTAATDDISWPPPVSLSYDISSSLTAYAGYTDIYQSQAFSLTNDRKPLPPIRGSNWEAGVKWATRDGRLNISLAAYRIQKKGFAVFDPSRPREDIGNGVSCCFIADPDASMKSKGFDLETTGEISPGWHISGSYTYSKNKQENGAVLYSPNGNGKPFLSIQPKSLYKLWMSYDFDAAGGAGALAGLTISGGVNGQSKAFRSGTVCVNPDPDVAPDPATGFQPCKSDAAPDYVDYAFTVPAYAVFSARADYRFTDIWSFALNLENILDKTYYKAVGDYPDSGNWYGTPRSVTATLRAKW